MLLVWTFRENSLEQKAGAWCREFDKDVPSESFSRPGRREEPREISWFFFFRWAVTDDEKSIDCFSWGKK